METEKLTLEDCFKYPNAEIIEYESEMPFKKCSDYSDIIELIEHRISSIPYVVSNCKLQLRTIEDLTEEEKKHIYLNYCETFREIEYIEWHIPLTAFIFRYVENILPFIDKLREWNIYLNDLPEGTYELTGKAVKL